MELLLGLAGLAGLAALLLQQKGLPSRAEAEKAFDTLDKNPLDPDANTVMGKYKAFVMGDYSGAMPYLVNSKDATFKALAEHELDDAYHAVPSQKVVMGDEWVAAAKKHPTLSRIFYDRATQWYTKAWPDLDEAWKKKAREQGRKLAAARPPGTAKRPLPSGWEPEAWIQGSKPPTLDGAVARTGSYSVKIPPSDPAVKGSSSGLMSVMVPVAGKKLEGSVYILADGTESAEDNLRMIFFDKNGAQMQGAQMANFIPTDIPFWNRVVMDGNIPENAVRGLFYVFRKSQKGEFYVDDASLKIDGKEVLSNRSFEEK